MQVGRNVQSGRGSTTFLYKQRIQNVLNNYAAIYIQL